MLNTAWLKQILSGEKLLFEAKEVTLCNPPRYDEISVKNLYDSCMKLPDMKLYFPTSYPRGRSCDRTCKHFQLLLQSFNFRLLLSDVNIASRIYL